MEEISIVNYVEIDGQEVLLEKLSPEKRKEISETIQERFMKAAGYKCQHRSV